MHLMSNLSIAPFVFLQAAYPALVKCIGEKIINIGSGYSIKAEAGNVSYADIKTELLNMTRSMALDCGEDNIQVNIYFI